MNFQFEAKNQEGQIVSGVISAQDESRAEKILWRNKLTVISMAPKKDAFSFVNSIIKRISIRDKLLFMKQLATMIDSGFPILQSLSVIVLQTENKVMKEIVAEMITDLEEGHTFSTAMSKHPETFPPFFINIVKAGEASGQLPKVLRELAEYIEREYEFYAKIRGAVAYPIFILIAMFGIGAIMMVKVVPQLVSIFDETGVTLPITTRMIIWMSNFIQNFWWLVIIVMIIGVILFRAWAKTDVGRKQIDLFYLKIPIINRLVQMVLMARFCRSFALLVSTGIPILKTIKMVSELIQNEVYRESLENVYLQVEKGVPISIPLGKSPFFPAMVPHMVGVGEKTGRLDEILESLAKFYEVESDTEMKKLSSLLEPILIIIIGIGVAIMVFAIIMPIYGLVQVIQ